MKKEERARTQAETTGNIVVYTLRNNYYAIYPKTCQLRNIGSEKNFWKWEREWDDWEFLKETTQNAKKTTVTTVTQIGMGCGQGETIEILPKEEIIKMIKDQSYTEILQKAISACHPGYADGYCAVDLQTGEIISFSLTPGSSFQACDNNHITLAVWKDYAENPYSAEDDQVREAILENIEQFPKLEKDFEIYEAKSLYEKEVEEIVSAIEAENEKYFESGCDFDWHEIDEQLEAFYG